jgi:uronate dehydrogenase
MSRLLITGAAGNMGRLLRPLLRREGRMLRLLDIAPIPNGDMDQGKDEVIAADLADAGAAAAACDGVDAILHLGGISLEASLDELLDVNIRGTANVLEGARTTGVRRVILASSNHAGGFYHRDDVPPGADGLPDNLPPRPDSLYGWSKAAIESLGALYHHRFGMDVIALRIGSCFPEPPRSSRILSTWFSPADAARLVEACLAAPSPGFQVLWAVSDNTRRWWSLAGARALGYEPQDNAEELADRIGDPNGGDPVNDYVGGVFCLTPLGERMH